MTALVESALDSADVAARAARVNLREITDLDGFRAVTVLYDNIWRPDPTNPPINVELLRALSKAGNYVAGAYEGDRLVAACVGFFGPPAEASAHSHIAGVSADMRGRGVGLALKLHQRAWALQRGASTITWTFDPLVRRNAYFNVVRLAASPVQYLPNFYGGMHDGINAGGESDRLLTLWALDSPRVVAACAGAVGAAGASADAVRARGAVVGLGRRADGGPQAGDLDGDTVLVAVPADIESLRVSDPSCAGEWRLALREALTTLFARGAAVTGVDRAGWYVLTTVDAAHVAEGNSA